MHEKNIFVNSGQFFWLSISTISLNPNYSAILATLQITSYALGI
jgi:hypothetical protein